MVTEVKSCKYCAGIIIEWSDNHSEYFVHNWLAGKCMCPRGWSTWSNKTGEQISPAEEWFSLYGRSK